MNQNNEKVQSIFGLNVVKTSPGKNGDVFYTSYTCKGVKLIIQFGWQKNTSENLIPIRVFQDNESVWSLNDEKDKHKFIIRPSFYRVDEMPIIAICGKYTLLNDNWSIIKVIPLISLVKGNGLLPHELLNLKVKLAGQERMVFDLLDEEEAEILEFNDTDVCLSESELQLIEHFNKK